MNFVAFDNQPASPLTGRTSANRKFTAKIVYVVYTIAPCPIGFAVEIRQHGVEERLNLGGVEKRLGEVSGGDERQA